MKAIVWKTDGRLEQVTNWHSPSQSDHEVLVRIHGAGICTTDLHMISGKLDFAKPPWVLGHEMAGTIENIGAHVIGWHVGERVIIDPVVSCGSCRHCLSGRKYLCSEGGELGTTYGSGGYGEYVVVQPCNLYRLPTSLSFVEGAMMEPLNCTLGAIDRVRNIVGSHVAVFGGGPAGLLFVQLAKAYGALSVTLLDVREEPLQLGRKLGSDETVNLIQVPAEQYRAGKTFDVTIEASGSLEAVKACFDFVAPSGTVVLYGLNGSKEPSIPSDQIVSKDLSVVTCTSAPLLWDRGIRLVESGKVNVKDIVSHQVPFNEAARMINELVERKRSVIKAIIITEEVHTQ